jgi:hypothetical protein
LGVLNIFLSDDLTKIMVDFGEDIKIMTSSADQTKLTKKNCELVLKT